jgi:hypothetical protein
VAYSAESQKHLEAAYHPAAETGTLEAVLHLGEMEGKACQLEVGMACFLEALVDLLVLVLLQFSLGTKRSTRETYDPYPLEMAVAAFLAHQVRA